MTRLPLLLLLLAAPAWAQQTARVRVDRPSEVVVEAGPDGRLSIVVVPVGDAPGPYPGPVPVPPAPEPQPTPAPGPRPNTLERVAWEYGQALAASFSVAADLVRTGRAATVQDAQDAVSRQFAAAKQEFGRAIDAAASAYATPDGRITDPAQYARMLDEIARGMGGKP